MIESAKSAYTELKYQAAKYLSSYVPSCVSKMDKFDIVIFSIIFLLVLRFLYRNFHRIFRRRKFRP